MMIHFGVDVGKWPPSNAVANIATLAWLATEWTHRMAPGSERDTQTESLNTSIESDTSSIFYGSNLTNGGSSNSSGNSLDWVDWDKLGPNQQDQTVSAPESASSSIGDSDAGYHSV